MELFTTVHTPVFERLLVMQQKQIYDWTINMM